MLKSTSLFVCMFQLSILSAQSSATAYLAFQEDSLFYEWAGSGQAVILIHDGLLHHEVWEDQFSEFSKHFKVIRYDRRGYGASSAATDSYIHLEDLNALFTQMEIEHAVLIACSSGGALAVDFTLTYPQKVDGLVLVGAVAGGFSYTPHIHNRGGHLPDRFESELDQAEVFNKSVFTFLQQISN